ncbi:NTP transferase domain-containing protein [Pseudoalteromonas sp. G4]|uniref:NTP transferase domain-containing protein n=1 Tax=Pseudoalteromonas sp. G4 TaxID=2992761 RepID=UPI00237ECDA1|nr:NTP transferase domain-containing protein [Pseudoalteromonas sp. G4]MDE3273492.1 NTP transferase domain-containing protein [Pseudoalteromonas sp. G4]
MVHGSCGNSTSSSKINPSDVSLVILAGGLGRRFGGNKQLAEVPGIGKTLLELSIQDAFDAGIRHLVLVVNAAIKETVEAQILPRLNPNLSVDLAVQSISDVPLHYQQKSSVREKPWGTGHALLAARSFVKPHFVVITADDYYGKSGVLGYPLVSTLTSLGGVNRGICELNGTLLNKITEVLNIDADLNGETPSGDKVSLSSEAYASMTIWALSFKIFTQLEDGFIDFLKQDDSAINGEFFLPDQIQYLIAEHGQIVELLPAKDLWLGVTYSDDLHHVAAQLSE